ncbi:MAG: hypothetical protein K2M31_03325 [Muribaculaceae bacterium]|nr:hypothetical protein [Muribaculaceae bacterium]
MNLIIEEDFASRLPEYRVILIEADVKVEPTSDAQKKEMDELAAGIASRLKVEDINKQAPIVATRRAYKICGKDPNRYRPSQEQLMRRIVRGLGLYNVDSLVDAGNQLSLMTGCSVGCFDRDKVEGDCLSVGIGRHEEPYEGIGRGPLNVEGLPIVRDSRGGIGTPTSDNERTKISSSTRQLVMTIHLFDPAADADGIISLAKTLMGRHAKACNFKENIVSVD